MNILKKNFESKVFGPQLHVYDCNNLNLWFWSHSQSWNFIENEQGCFSWWDIVASRCNCYHYYTNSFTEAWNQVLRRLKTCSRCVEDSRWWGSLTIVPAGNKAKRLSPVNHTKKTILHHHHHIDYNEKFEATLACIIDEFLTINPFHATELFS